MCGRFTQHLSWEESEGPRIAARRLGINGDAPRVRAVTLGEGYPYGLWGW